MHNATRLAGIYSPRHPELARPADLLKMLAAYRFPGEVTVSTYLDQARGIALGAVWPRQSAAPGWWQDTDAVVAFDGRIRTAAGEQQGPAAAEAIALALKLRTPLEDLAGEFGFAAWDGETGNLVLGNDPYGRASIQYIDDAGTGLFAFASEAKSLLEHPAARREPSPEGIGLYLRDGTIFGSFSAFAGMKKLGTGEVLRMGPDGRRQQGFYWSFPAVSIAPRLLEEWGSDVGGRVRRDILNYARGDGPTGVLFSAGLDSSIVVALLNEAGRDIRGLTASYPASFRSRPSDYPYARQTGEALGFPCEEVIIEPVTALPVTSEVLLQLDQPNIQVSSMITFKLLLNAARPHGIDLCLTGMGTEEAYGIDFWGGILRGRADGTIASDADVHRLAEEPNHFSDALVDEMLGINAAATMQGALMPYQAILNSDDIYDVIRRLYLWMVRRARLLEWTEALAVIDPIEIRHPFNQWTTLQFSETIPSAFKGSQDASMYKALLRQPFGHLIPPWVKERDSRGLPGFVIGEYRFEALERYLFDPKYLASTGLFGGVDISKYLRKRQFRKLLTWLMLWHDIHVTRRQESLNLLASI